MIVYRDNKHLIFKEVSDQELIKLRRILSWEDQHNAAHDIMLWYDDNIKCYYTLFGLQDILQHEFHEFKVLGEETKREFDYIEFDDNLLPGIKLYDFQVMAIRKGVGSGTGIIELPTGSGKSEVGVGIIKLLLDSKRINSALIITPSVYITNQFADRAAKRGIDPNMIGVIDQYHKDYDKPIIFAVADSIGIGLNDRHEFIERIIHYDLLIVDECHTIVSNRLFNIVYKSQHKYLIGLSGTPFRNDTILDTSGDAFVYGITGGVICKVPPRPLIERGILAEPIIFMKPISGMMKKYKARYKTIYDREIIDKAKRNKIIVEYCNTFCKAGLSVLVSVNEKRHAITLMENLRKNNPDIPSICIFGGSEAHCYDDVGSLDKFMIDQNTFNADFTNGKYKVIFATQVLDQGVDLPTVGALIMAGAGKSRRQIRQRLGRGTRRKIVGRNVVFVLDFIDRGHVWLYQQAMKRLTQMYLIDMEADVLETEREFLNIINDV